MTNPTTDLLIDIEQADLRYSTFWQRFLAIIVDALVLTPFVIADSFNKSGWKSLPLSMAILAVTVVYKPFMEAKYGATLGKMALGLTIINTDYERADLKNVLLRNIIDIVSRLLTGLITVMAFSSADFLNVESFSQYSAVANAVGAVTILYLTSGIGLVDAIVLIADSTKRRALHDRIGQTLVVHK